MARYFLAAILWVVVLVVLYLLGAFVAATFRITEWATEGRMLVAFLGVASAVPLFVLVPARPEAP